MAAYNGCLGSWLPQITSGTRVRKRRPTCMSRQSSACYDLGQGRRRYHVVLSSTVYCCACVINIDALYIHCMHITWWVRSLNANEALAHCSAMNRLSLSGLCCITRRSGLYFTSATHHIRNWCEHVLEALLCSRFLVYASPSIVGIHHGMHHCQTARFSTAGGLAQLEVNDR